MEILTGAVKSVNEITDKETKNKTGVFIACVGYWKLEDGKYVEAFANGVLVGSVEVDTKCMFTLMPYTKDGKDKVMIHIVSTKFIDLMKSIKPKN